MVQGRKQSVNDFCLTYTEKELPLGTDLWQPGEPDNYRGEQDKALLFVYGANRGDVNIADWAGRFYHRYICEKSATDSQSNQ